MRNAASTASKTLGYAGAGFYVANLVLDDEYRGSTYGLEETGNDFWNE